MFQSVVNPYLQNKIHKTFQTPGEIVFPCSICYEKFIDYSKFCPDHIFSTEDPCVPELRRTKHELFMKCRFFYRVVR